MRQPLGVVHILIPSQAAEYRLPQQSGQKVAGVLSTATFRQRACGEIGQPERIIEFSVSKQSGVRGDVAAVEFEPQPTVEINPKGAVIRFTRWVFHDCVLRSPTKR